MMEKKILIIGKNGFIGNKLFNIFEKNLFTVFGDIINNKKIRLTGIKKIKDLIIKKKINVIIHTASSLHSLSSYKDFQYEMKKLILPTLDLIQFCSEKKIRFIYFSSGGQMYGKNINKVNEKFSINPFNYAGYSKSIIENAIIFFHKNFKLDYLILRPGNVFEMNEQNKIKKFSLISTINSLPANGAIHVRNNGNDIRDYIHVDQVSDIILTLVINNYRNITLNLSSGSGFKTKDVIKILNKKVKIVYKKNISSKNNQEAKKIILNNSLLKKIYKKKIIHISKLNDL